MSLGQNTAMKLRQMVALIGLGLALYGAWKAVQRARREFS
jgi:hypothetical protein